MTKISALMRTPAFIVTLLSSITAVSILMAVSYAPTFTDAKPISDGANPPGLDYQDWRINCPTTDQVMHCSMIQIQADPKTKQRVLAMEIRKGKGDAFTAILVMPFGLALAEGVSLQIDDSESGNSLPFTTCQPAGCLVPFIIDSDKVKALKRGAKLTVTASADGPVQPVVFAVSLNGFAGALDRLVELGK